MARISHLQRKIQSLAEKVVKDLGWSKIVFSLFVATWFAFFTALFTTFFLIKGISQLTQKFLLPLLGARTRVSRSLGSQNNSGNVASQDKTFTLAEVAKHSRETDCWIIVQGAVYDVTSYLYLHPGGAGTILAYCGRDATEAFLTKGGKGAHSSQAWDILSSFQIGVVKDYSVKVGSVGGKIRPPQTLPFRGEGEEIGEIEDD